MDRDLVLYRFYDNAGTLLYVGKSVNAWRRFRDHRDHSPFFGDATSVTLQRGFSSEDALLATEAAVIRRERPMFNAHHNGSGDHPSLLRLDCLVEDVARFVRSQPDGGREMKAQLDRCVESILTLVRTSPVGPSAEERRTAAREARRSRGQHVGRPPALTGRQREQVLKLHGQGESVIDIAQTFGVGRDTVYRVIRAAQDEEAE